QSFERAFSRPEHWWIAQLLPNKSGQLEKAEGVPELLDFHNPQEHSGMVLVVSGRVHGFGHTASTGGTSGLNRGLAVLGSEFRPGDRFALVGNVRCSVVMQMLTSVRGVSLRSSAPRLTLRANLVDEGPARVDVAPACGLLEDAHCDDLRATGPHVSSRRVVAP
ncbi:MAG: hypothetical protein O2843_11085, partial [Chloroflexi bacterium]|nr:hypothetical protein [Chloroflexota bacterium]